MIMLYYINSYCRVPTDSYWSINVLPGLQMSVSRTYFTEAIVTQCV